MIQNIAIRLQHLTLSNASFAGVIGISQKLIKKSFVQENLHLHKNIHTSTKNLKKGGTEEPDHFLSYNKKFYPIQSPDEERRPAFVCHQKCNIRYTPKKMTYVAWLVRGLTVNEALKQLDFVAKKGATAVKETIKEAIELAVKDHNVEFRSNLWVAESFVGKAFVIKGVRRHAKGRPGEVRYTFCHYFVRLEEGEPPKDYYKRGVDKSSDELLAEWKNKLRLRKIPHSL